MGIPAIGWCPSLIIMSISSPIFSSINWNEPIRWCHRLLHMKIYLNIDRVSIFSLSVRSCVNHQFQFHTQIAYKHSYMTYDLCYLILFVIGTDIKFNHTNSANPFFGTRARPFHFRQWLRVCAVKIGTSYFGNLFLTCQQVLGHACHIWYSLWLKWPITTQHVQAQWGLVVSWRACSTGSKKAARVSRSIGHFWNGLQKYLQILITD